MAVRVPSAMRRARSVTLGRARLPSRLRRRRARIFAFLGPLGPVPLAAVAIRAIIVRGSYRMAERIFVWFTLPFFAYPIAAVLAHPHWSSVGKAIVVPHLHAGSTYLLILIATAGTTITPYMQLYL